MHSKEINILIDISLKSVQTYNSKLDAFKAKLVHFFSASKSLFLELAPVINEIDLKSPNDEDGIRARKKYLSDITLELQFEDILSQKLKHICEGNTLMMEFANTMKLNAEPTYEQTVASVLTRTTQLHIAQLEQIRKECEIVSRALDNLFSSPGQSINYNPSDHRSQETYNHTVRNISELKKRLQRNHKIPSLLPISDIDQIIDEQRNLIKKLNSVSQIISVDVQLFLSDLKEIYTVESERTIFEKVMILQPSADSGENMSVQSNEPGSIDFF